MSSLKSTAASAAAIVMSLSGSGAVADVAPDQVWQDWKTYMSGFGYAVEADESMSGDTLTVSDITMTMDIPEEEGQVSVMVEKMTFTDRGDGSVSIGIPPSLPITVDVAGDDVDEVTVHLDYDTTGFAMTVSGDPDDMTYNYTAGEIMLALREVVVDDETMDLGTAQIAMADVTGTSTMTKGALRSSEQKMSTGAVNYTVDISDPEGSGNLFIEGGAENMDFRGEGDFPAEMDPENMAAMIAAGFSASGRFSYEGGKTEFKFTEDGEEAQGMSSTDSGMLEVRLNGDELHYAGGAENMAMKMQGSDLPMPVEWSMQELGFDFTVPVMAREEPQDFAISLTLGDLSVSEMLWSMIDPEGKLPHDPATLAFDISGSGVLDQDLLDPEQMEAVERQGEAPGELESVDLNALNVALAGAKLTGEGGFTFDNADTETFDGMPAPEGSVDLKLVGGNALLDKLVEMGLMPEEEAQGARMMLGLFAVPSGEDTLTSTIEVTEDGKVLANGQRLQ
jgi:hypothetical protein